MYFACMTVLVLILKIHIAGNFHIDQLKRQTVSLGTYVTMRFTSSFISLKE